MSNLRPATPSLTSSTTALPVKNLPLDDLQKQIAEILATDTDNYEDDEAELKFLKSKPTCFIVLGKPCSGKTSIARMLANVWKCELVTPYDLIIENIDKQSELGNVALEILLRGEAINDDMVLAMIENKMRSPEVAHHGYVLDCFPYLVDDQAAIRKQVELLKCFPLQPDFLIHIRIPDKDLSLRRVGQRVDPSNGMIYTRLVYDPEKVEEKKEKKKKEGEEEEEEEEEPEEPEEDEEGDEEAKQAELDPDVPFLGKDILVRLLRRPEDLEERAAGALGSYRQNMRSVVEELIIDHDRLKVIELDGNRKQTPLLHHILTKLQTFPVSKAVRPIRMKESDEDEVPEEMETEELMRQMGNKKVLAPRYRWRRSRWLRYCPVSLYDGFLVEGKPEFTVAFLDKLYCMATQQAYHLFLANPRPYLLPPMPRLPCKLVVTGQSYGGKSSIAALLATRYGGKVINVDEHMKPKLDAERQRRIEQARKDAIEQGIITVKTKLQIQLVQRKQVLEKEEMKRKMQEAAAARAAQERAQMETAEEQQPESEQSPGADLAGEDKPAEEEAEPEAEPVELDADPDADADADPEQPKPAAEEAAPAADGEEAEVEEEGEDDDAEVGREPSMSNEEFESIHGEISRLEMDIDAVNENHPEVAEYVEKQVREEEQKDVTLPADVWLDTIEDTIRKIEQERVERDDGSQKHGGWIFDNWPRTKEHWTAYVERAALPEKKFIMFDDVVCLRDTTEAQDALLKRWYSNNRNEIDLLVNERLERMRVELEKKAEEERRAEEAERQRLLEEAQRLRDEQGDEFGEEEQDKPEEGDDDQSPDQGENEEEAAGKGDEAAEAEAEGEAEAEAEAEAEGAGLSIDELQKLAEKPQEQEAPPPPAEDPYPYPGGEGAPMPEFEPKLPELPPEGPELEAQRRKVRDFETEWTAISTIIISAGVNPVELNAEPPVETVFAEACKQIEKKLEYSAWEVTGVDADEDDEDAAAEKELLDEAGMGEEEAEEAEEENNKDADPSRSARKHLGDTSFFCPVALKENGVLWPGNADFAARYREKTYYISSMEARERFLDNPRHYLDNKKPLSPPALRILIMGPKGSGKTAHGLQLAEKLGLFHIQFRERLHEIVLSKTKRRVGPDFQEEIDFDGEMKQLEEDEKRRLEDEAAVEKEEEEEKRRQDAERRAMAGETFIDSTSPQVPVAETPRPEDELKPDSNQPAAAPPAGQPQGLSLEERLALELELPDVEPEYTELETAVKDYLESDTPIAFELLEQILADFWRLEPYKSTGFILEGFPNNVDEVRFLCEYGFYPDCLLFMNVEPSDVVGRLLPSRMDKWRTRRDRKRAFKQAVKDQKAKKRAERMEKRRVELVKEREAQKLEALAERQAAQQQAAETEDAAEEEAVAEEAEEEEEENDEDAKIEEQLQEEFPEEEEEEDDEETEEDAKERNENELNDIVDADLSKLDPVREAIQEALIPVYMIKAGKRPHIVRYQLMKRLKQLMENRTSIFERVYPLPEKVAEKMLDAGFAKVSRFGRWCPVRLVENPIFPYYDEKHQAYPVLYRSYVYFLSSKNSRDDFIADPLRYLKQSSPKPVAPIRIAVTGPPKSGKTYLANRFSMEYGTLRVSIGEAMRFVLQQQKKTDLAQRMQYFLWRGLTVPDELATECLQVVLLDAVASTRGYVLDGYPTTKAQLGMMLKNKIVPLRFYDLQIDSREALYRGAQDRMNPARLKEGLILHDSPQVLALRTKAYRQEIEQVLPWYKNSAQNYISADALQSKWSVWLTVVEDVKKITDHLQLYYQRLKQQKALSISKLCITPEQFRERLGEYGYYCPVRLVKSGELVDNENQKSLKYAAEYRGRYYLLSGPEELNEFLEKPDDYLPPKAQIHLPSDRNFLPKRLTADDVKAIFPKPVEFGGYCPVTYIEGKMRYEAIVSGTPDLAVLYNQKLYYFESAEKLDRFMRTPEKYSHLTLPHKLPPKKEILPVGQLPILGFLEQALADVIIKGLTAVGQLKPKYPCLNSERSACVFLAYFLKAHNPKTPDYVRNKYRKKQRQFEDACGLGQYLARAMTINYKKEQHRPVGFDHKLNEFFALKSLTDNVDTWIS